jgi:ribosomal protein S18 acetylase RimI-like enzyme
MPSTAEHKRRIGCAPSAGGTFGAFVDGALVGMVGLHRLPRRKTRHRVALWGLYVTPGQRRQGLGRRLLDLALAHVEEAMPGVGLVELEVAADATHVRRLYEAVGFEPLGEHPGALLVDGEAVATVLYVRPVAAH